MANLYFNVESNYNEVIRLRDEIQKLEVQIKLMDANKAPQVIAILNTQMQESKQKMRELVEDAARAGAALENEFKKKIFDTSQIVNDLTQKITDQKSVIEGVENDVIALGNAYRSMNPDTAKSDSFISDYSSAKTRLYEEKAALFELTQEQAEALLSVQKLQKEYEAYQNSSKEVTTANQNTSFSLKEMLSHLGGMTAIKQLCSEIIKVRGEFQQMETTINILLGNKEKADALLSQIKDYAKVSPLTLSDISAATQMMLELNMEAEKIPTYFMAIGDISMGDSSKFNSLTLAFSQVSATGKLMGADLNQMIKAGFNPLSVISEQTGISVAQLKEEMSKGAISAEMVQQAFIGATSAGGKFYNMSQEASNGLSGQISILEGAIDNAYNEIGAKSEGVMVAGVQLATKMVENYETIGKVLVGLIGTYGIYQTALLFVTEAGKGYTKMEVIQFKWAVLTEKATKILNATMLNNPYVLVAATLGILLTALWAFADSSTAAEKAQERFNKRQEEAKKKEEERKQHLQSLISTIQDETISSLDKVKALDDIKKSYPALFQKYIDEKGHIKDLIGFWKEYNEEASKKAVKDNKQSEDDIYEKIKKTKAQIQESKESALSASSFETRTMYEGEVQVLTKQLENLQHDLLKVQKQVREDNLNQWKVDLKQKTDEQITYELSEMKRLKDERAEHPFADFSLTRDKVSDKKYEPDKSPSILAGGMPNAELVERIDAAQTELDSRQKGAVIKNKAFWTQQEKDAKTAIDAIGSAQLTLLKAGTTTGIDQEVINTYKKNTSLLKEAQKVLEIYNNTGGKTDNKAEELAKQAERFKELTDKNARERARAEKDAAIAKEQSDINALQEGAEKRLRQRSLNHKKELDAIQQEAETKKLKVIEMAKAEFEANPDNAKKGFNVDTFIQSEPAIKQFSMIENERSDNEKNANTKYNNNDDLSSLLNEYQDYTDERIAIEKKFNNDIAILDGLRTEALKSGNIEQVDKIDKAKAKVTKEKGQSLMEFDYKQLQKTPEYERAFENLQQTSSETLRSLLAQFENAKQKASQEFNINPNELREYTTTIESIMNELASRNPFQALSDKKQELVVEKEKLAQSHIELENALQQKKEVEGGAKIETGKGTTTFNHKTGKLEYTKSYLTEAEALKNVEEKTREYNKSKDNVVKANAKVKKAEKDVTKQINELSSAISGLGAQIGGPAGEIISLIGDIGTFAMTAVQGVKTATDTSVDAIGAVEKASVILAIITTAIQIAMKIASLFKDDDGVAAYEKAKNVYESYINILDKVIEKQKELFHLNSETGEQAYDKAKDTVKNKENTSRDLGKQYLNSGASRGFLGVGSSSSRGVEQRKDISSNALDQAKSVLGTDYNKATEGRMTGLFDLSVKQLTDLQRDAPLFWAELHDDTRKYLENIIACSDQLNKIEADRKEGLTQISYDSFLAGFIDTLNDMDASSKDFAENFEDYMKNALLSSLITNKYQSQIKKLYDKWASYTESDRELTKEEAESLRKEQEELAASVLKDREELAKTFGWKTNESSSPDSSSGGFETMSQETGSELNGRFTDIQMKVGAMSISLDEIKANYAESYAILSNKADSILIVNSEAKSIADEIRTVQVNSYLELQAIRENTGAIIKPIKDMNEKLEKIEKNTSKL